MKRQAAAAARHYRRWGMRMRGHWLLGLAATCLASPADAATVRNFNVAGWNASVHTDRGGAFSHCASSSKYKSGISVIFSVNKNMRWTVGFMHPDWKYNVGDTFPIAFTIDDMKPISDRVTAFAASGVRLEADDSAELFKRFRLGNRLRVATVQRVFEFNLTGTNEMLTSLAACAYAKGRVNGTPPMASNPFAPPEAARPRQADGAASATLRVEATAFAANLLSAANITGYRLLGPDEPPKVKGDARWIVPGKELGIVKILPGLKKEEQKAFGADLISEDARQCTGKFASGSMPDDEKGIARAFTICDLGEAILSMYYFTLPRPAGGAYVIATGSFGGEEAAAQAKEKHENFRNAAYTVIPR